MSLIFAVVGGVLVGVLIGSSTVPKIKWVELITTLLLLGFVGFAQLPQVDNYATWGLVFVLTSAIATVISSAWKWSELAPLDEASFFDYIIWEVTKPRQLRALYQEAGASSRPEA